MATEQQDLFEQVHNQADHAILTNAVAGKVSESGVAQLDIAIKNVVASVVEQEGIDAAKEALKGEIKSTTNGQVGEMQAEELAKRFTASAQDIFEQLAPQGFRGRG